LSNWISSLRKMHFSNESRKRKTNCSWPLTLIMQKRDHFRLLRHHYSISPVIPLSNDISYRCVAHGFITFYFLIFYRWSIMIGEKDLGQYVENVERVFILYVWEIISVEQNNKCLIMNPINLMNLFISFSYIGGLKNIRSI
jgi:hypothetical protein